MRCINKLKCFAITLLLVAPATAWSASDNSSSASPIRVAQCGPFELDAYDDGYMHIDGVKPWSQKVTGAKGNDLSHATFQWMVPYPRVGWLGMNYYVGADNKRWLDVQYVQGNKDAPKLYGQYPCESIKG